MLFRSPNRLYLFGYTNPDAPPSAKTQGYTIGSRQDGTANTTGDKLYCLLAATNGATPSVQSAYISPYGSSVTGSTPNTSASPLKFDTSTYTISGQTNQVGGWYIQTQTVGSGITNTIFSTLTTNTQYASASFTPATYIKRKPDSRVLKDRIYRYRYVVPKDSFPVPREPITGYVIQPRSSETSSPKYNKCYYIYEIEKIQAFERGVTDGIYYLTILCASIAPSTSNFNDFYFSQNVNEVYPAFDRDNPKGDPTAAVSVADNVTIGLVYATDGQGTKNTQRSITKEARQSFLAETQNNFAWNSSAGTLGSYTLTARSGNEETRKIPLKVDTSNNMIPIQVEIRRHSIQRSGNHTFEYTGFGPVRSEEHTSELQSH